AEQHDVGLLQLDRVFVGAGGLHALVVVVDRDGQRLLRVVLADHVPVEELVDLARLGQLVELDVGAFGELFLDDLVAQVDALVADVHAGAGDELLDLLLALPAEGALEQVATVTDACHSFSFASSVPARRARRDSPAGSIRRLIDDGTASTASAMP